MGAPHTTPEDQRCKNMVEIAQAGSSHLRCVAGQLDAKDIHNQHQGGRGDAGRCPAQGQESRPYGRRCLIDQPMTLPPHTRSESANDVRWTFEELPEHCLAIGLARIAY